MHGWLNIMLRITALCLLLVGALQANAACVEADLAAAHSTASADMHRSHDTGIAAHHPPPLHPPGGALCVQACVFGIMEPFTAPPPARVSTLAFLRPSEEAPPPSLQPDTVERPPKPLV